MIKKIKKQYKRYHDTMDLMKSIRSSSVSNYIGMHAGMEGQLVYDAQKLQADVYLSRNFICISDVQPDGRMHINADPHQLHSTYFIIRNRVNGRIIATSRQIQIDPAKLHDSFPILEKAQIEPEWRDYILSQDLGKMVEISGLAKLKDATSMAPLYLYRQMWHFSIKQNHDLWLMACDVRLFQRLSVILGDAIIQVGKETKYQGGNVIPAILKPKQALGELIDSVMHVRRAQRYLRMLVLEFFIEDLPPHSITNADRMKLRELGIIKSKEVKK